jgi:O-antigen/teichoic acid export membrane protein
MTTTGTDGDRRAETAVIESPAARPVTSGEHSRSIVSTSALLALRKIIVAIAGAVATAVLARALSVSDFGTYSAVLATYYLASSACDLGFGAVLSRELVTRPAERAALLRATTRAALGWSALVALIAIATVVLTQSGNPKSIALLTLAPALAVSGATTSRVLFYADYDARRIAVIDTVTNLAQSAALVGAALIGTPIWILTAIVAAASLINTGLATRLALRRVGSGRARRGDSWAITRMAVPFGIASVLASAYFSVDLVLVGYLLSSQDTGHYAAAVKLLSLVTMLPGLLMGVALPGLAALDAAGSPEEVNRLLANLWRWLLVSVGMLCWAILCFAPAVVALFYGPGYESAIGPLRILMLAGLAALASNLLGTLMVSRRRGAAMFGQNAIALGANVGLNLLLLPVFGISAAAWLTLGTEAFVCACSAYTLRAVVRWRALLLTSGRPMYGFAVLAVAALIPGPVVIRMLAGGLAALLVLTLADAWPVEIQRAIAGLRWRFMPPTIGAARDRSGDS